MPTVEMTVKIVVETTDQNAARSVRIRALADISHILKNPSPHSIAPSGVKDVKVELVGTPMIDGKLAP